MLCDRDRGQCGLAIDLLVRRLNQANHNVQAHCRHRELARKEHRCSAIATTNEQNPLLLLYLSTHEKKHNNINNVQNDRSKATFIFPKKKNEIL